MTDSSLTGMPLLAPAASVLCLWVTAAWIAALASPGLIARTAALAPQQRALALLALALAPPVAALLVTAATFAAPLSAVMVGTHCHAGHCGTHVPVATIPPGYAPVATVAFMLLLALVTGSAVLAFRRMEASSRALAMLATPLQHARVRVLQSERIFAACCGVMRPSIVVSSGLVARASAADLRIILLHERAHWRRGDNLRLLLAQLAMWPWPQYRRTPLLNALRGAADEACDAVAARTVGSAERVAHTLARMREWHGGRLESERECTARIAALTRPAHTISPFPTLPIAALACMLVVALLPGAVHHAAEICLSWF